MSVLSVALGGALGALGRYGLSGWVHRYAGATFPWGTMTVNVLGSLLIGFSLAWLEASPLPPRAREFVAIGLLGSFTTFSTFTYEALALLRDGEWLRAAGYLGGSVLLGLAAVVGGLWLAQAALRGR